MATITKYVNADAGGAGDGSAPDTTNAWTMAQCISAMAGTLNGNDGNIYFIGTFTTKLDIDAAGTSAAAPLVFRGDYNTVDSSYAACVIDTSGTECVIIAGAAARDYLTVKNMSLVNSGNGNGALQVLGSGGNSRTYIICDGLTITNFNRRGIQYTITGDYTGSEIKNCTIDVQANNGVGVKLATTPGVKVHGNTITSSASAPTNGSHIGVEVVTTATGARIYNNTITGMNNGVDISGTDSCRVHNNTITAETDGSTSRCINIDGSSGLHYVYANTCIGGSIAILDDTDALGGGVNKYFGNLIYGHYTNGLDYRSDYDGYAILAHNTIIHDPVTTAGHGLDVQSQAAATAKVWIYSNLIIAKGTTANNNGIQLASNLLVDVLIGGNVYYSSGGGQIFGDLAGGDQSPDTLSAWITAIDADASITETPDASEVVVTTDPLTDEANGDYTLAAGSGAVGVGYNWWAAEPWLCPEGVGGAISCWDTDAGCYPSDQGPFHPTNL